MYKAPHVGGLGFLCAMPRRPAVARERLAQILYLPTAAITYQLDRTPDQATTLLRQHGLIHARLAVGAGYECSLLENRCKVSRQHVQNMENSALV